MVDTLGLLLTVVVHSADVQDRDGAKLLVERLKCYLPLLHLVFADGAYAGSLVNWSRNSALDAFDREATAAGHRLCGPA